MRGQPVDRKCEKRRLAAHGPFNVQICDCGAVHLTAGFVTLRLEPSAYCELAAVVNEGLLALTVQTAPTLH
jgi:hypothetical protein